MPRAAPSRGVGDNPVAEEGAKSSAESAGTEATIVQFQSRHVVCEIDRLHGERYVAAGGDLEGDCEGAWSRIGVHGAVTIAMESFSRYHLSTNQSFRCTHSNASSFYTHTRGNDTI